MRCATRRQTAQSRCAAVPLADQVEVSVHDTGDGIAPDELPFVFDRFWRGDKSRARETGGSGLGLAIAKQLIEAQGGSIGVESKRGRAAASGSVCRSQRKPSPGSFVTSNE